MKCGFDWPSRFREFHYIWAWQQSLSCDLDHLYKLLFPLAKEAPHEMWLSMAKWFRRCLKMVDNDNNYNDGRRSMGIL